MVRYRLIYTILKYTKKETEKRTYKFLWNYQKNETSQAPSFQLSIWKCGLAVLDIDTRLNILKTK